MRWAPLQDARKAFVSFDKRLDVWVARHTRELRIVVTTLGFGLLFSCVALHALRSGLAAQAQPWCGSPCQGIPAFDLLSAAACGLAAILFIKLYATLTGAVQRRLIDPWKHVRPEPAPAHPPRWAVMLHVLIGLVVFLLMTPFATWPADGLNSVIVEAAQPRTTRVLLDGLALLELLLGWWIGGRIVLGVFWPKPRSVHSGGAT